MACKTEEFNVSIGQFVSNIKGDKVKAMEIILSNELLLMQRLNYYLTIHNPYRPVEGFLIDIKTRCSLVNPDRLRAGIDEFLENTFFTEACLLFAPSQIALAAVLHAASKEQENLDNYVIESLFHNTRDKLKVLIAAVQKIRLMVKNVAIPEKEEFRRIEKKLDRCRNQDNNPASEALVLLISTAFFCDQRHANCLLTLFSIINFRYKIRMKKMLEDEDDLDLDTSAHSLNERSLANESMVSIG